MALASKSTYTWTVAWLLGAVIGSDAAFAAAMALPPAQTGMASIYSQDLNGKNTASGERYDSHALTAAHRTLPLGAEVLVTRVDNGRSVRVRINDRGPNVANRIIDLSADAANALGMRSGVARVKLDVLSVPSGAKPHL